MITRRKFREDGHAIILSARDMTSTVPYYSLDKKLAQEVQSIAQKRGFSADTLINLWAQEKIQEQNP